MGAITYIGVMTNTASGALLAATTAATVAVATVAAAAGVAAAAEQALPSFVPVEVSLFEDRDASGKKIYKFGTEGGHSFYTRDKDEPFKSTCTDECKEDWSPVRARAGAKGEAEWTLFDRGNGYMQWMYKGKPIYQNVAQALGQDPEIPPGWAVLEP